MHYEYTTAIHPVPFSLFFPRQPFPSWVPCTRAPQNFVLTKEQSFLPRKTQPTFLPIFHHAVIVWTVFAWLTSSSGHVLISALNGKKCEVFFVCLKRKILLVSWNLLSRRKDVTAIKRRNIMSCKIFVLCNLKLSRRFMFHFAQLQLRAEFRGV